MDASRAVESSLAQPPCLAPHAQESLRKYSVVPVVTRNLVADDELGGHKLPKGTWIVCHIQVRLLPGQIA